MDQTNLSLHWQYALSLAVSHTQKYTKTWKFRDEELQSGLFEGFPDIERMIEVCDGFTAEGERIPVPTVKTFQEARDTLVHRIRPAYQAGQTTAQSYYHHLTDQPLDQRQTWNRRDVYLAAYEQAPEGLSTLESRWFAEGFHNVWENWLAGNKTTNSCFCWRSSPPGSVNALGDGLYELVLARMERL